MTVRELKERLNEFDDNLIVLIPNRYWESPCQRYEVVARNVLRGVNEFDGYLFIDDYVEDEDE